MDQFLEKFMFKPELRGAIGVEREFFLLNHRGEITPHASQFLAHMENPQWTHELSACIVEHRTAPCLSRGQLLDELEQGTVRGKKIANELNLQLQVHDIAPEDIPLTVFPIKRYQEIAQKLPEPVLSAACRLAGVHFHLGVSDLSEALIVYERLIKQVGTLISLGDKTKGDRMRLYSMVAPDWQPVALKSTKDLFELSVSKGFTQNPRNWWQVIRISIHGTVEVRTFGMTNALKEIIEWAKIVHSIAFLD